MPGIKVLGLGMKGVVFTEFLDHVAGNFGDDMVDNIIDDCDLPSGGAYTSVGRYDHSEIVSLVVALSGRTGSAVPDLVKGFGVYLGTRFSSIYHGFFEASDDLFSFLDTVDGVIHVEVLKLYPDAELPKIQMRERTDRTSVLRYRSARGMEDLAEGLIIASSQYYGEPVTVSRTAGEDAEGPYTDFQLTLGAASLAA